MKKMIAVIFILALFSASAFTACDYGMGKFYVNFDAQDGSPVIVQSQWVRLNERIPVYEPDEPTREDYVFKGWYKESACENKWDFENDTLKSGDNITLYAYWVKNELPAPVITSASFYDLQEAYNNGFITREDLCHISYFMTGEIWEYTINCDGGAKSTYKIDFVPQIETPALADLDNQIISDMKKAFYERNKQEIDDTIKELWLKDGCIITPIDFISIVSFLGKYNDVYAVRMTSSLWEYGLGSYSVDIAYDTGSTGGAGITWEMFSSPILIFAYNEEKTVPFSTALIENKMGSQSYDYIAAILDSAFSCMGSNDLLNGFEFWLDYDEAFFAEKTLVVYIFNASTTGGGLEVKQLTKQGKNLIMDIYFLAGDDTALSYWTVVLEVNKADIVGINEVIVKDYEINSLEATGHFFVTGFGGGLINLPYNLYGDYTPSIFYGDTNIVTFSDEKQVGIFSETYSQSWSETENWWVRDNEFSNLINNYDETFFQDNQIITFFVMAAGGAYYFELSKVTYSNGVLTIEIDHVSEGAGHCAIVNWFGIVEAPKKPADTEIVIKVNNRD